MAELTLRASKVAQLLGRELRGEDRDITGPGTLEEAGAGTISFLANPKYISQLSETAAGTIILHAEQADKAPHGASLILSPNPYLDFARVLVMFVKPQGEFTGISPNACIAPDAVLGAGCTAYPFVFVGPRAKIGDKTILFPGAYIGEDCELGEGVIVYPNAVLMAGTKVGAGSIIHPGAVLGADGFGFVPGANGIEKIPQVGCVSVGASVEIGANAAIDRAALGETRIGDGTKIDNLVQLGHNVRMGKNCLIVSQVGISGSTHVGDRVTMAGQVGVAGHLHIGNGVTIGPKSGVARDIPENETVGGIPVVDRGTYMRTLALMPKFPDMYKRIGQLEKELARLKEELAAKG